MFYKSISDVYDFIFPQNKKQLIFIDGIKNISKDEVILDVGCATGNLSELLGERADNVTGIDLDSSLLSKANDKHNNSHVKYKLIDMLKIDNHFLKCSFDRVVCFGNTLVHLNNRNDVKVYLQKVFKLLKSDGLLIVQIINYNRVIKGNITSLPTIDNKKISFIRNYEYHNNGDYVDFNTKLTIKTNNQVIENSIPLLALTDFELREYLKLVGFKNITFYGDLNGGKLSQDSIPLLFSCVKT
ncbi:MAG: class I SAM-dependent methyltransferase [Spirochaetaceae bacterium]